MLHEELHEDSADARADARADALYLRLNNKTWTDRVGIYMSFGPSIPVYTCIYTDTRIYGLNTYDD